MKEPKSEAANQGGSPALASAPLLAAADPFVRLIAIIDALPPGHLPSDDTPVADVIPGVWPTLGELRAFVKAANDPSSATAATRGGDCNHTLMPPFAAAHG